MSARSRAECVLDLFTRVSQVSGPLIGSPLSLQRWVVDRAAERRLELSRDLVHLVTSLIRTAHQRFLIFRLGIMR
ncbi:hypothetical protein A5753_09300 [Mycobacterium sp. 852002-51971_SCH5477799-a]|nr:hypothetical protein A5753_09300 [Mycobacterium sp. 852002-51971_SCH5477799-a]